MAEKAQAVREVHKALFEVGREDLLQTGVLSLEWVGIMRQKRSAESGVIAMMLACSPPKAKVMVRVVRESTAEGHNAAVNKRNMHGSVLTCKEEVGANVGAAGTPYHDPHGQWSASMTRLSAGHVDGRERATSVSPSLSAETGSARQVAAMCSHALGSMSTHHPMAVKTVIDLWSEEQAGLQGKTIDNDELREQFLDKQFDTASNGTKAQGLQNAKKLQLADLKDDTLALSLEEGTCPGSAWVAGRGAVAGAAGLQAIRCTG
ncbi:hypothetical protein NDU88_001254 [Pleurodeles waltl]|uniref:Uncharacterized protein n=1 Tax=Pleurodeles waltl TaxID=8319 RepID=A0AAV7UTI5_PLEWA|nr:hypothetical protein NDU88_001254 [Pleurodeles waltl]